MKKSIFKDLFSEIFKTGVLIKTSVRYPRLNKKLKPEDIGLQSTEQILKQMSLGHRKLCDQKHLAPFGLAESRVNALIRNNTFPFMGVFNFMPNTKLETATVALDSIKNGLYLPAKEEFISHYSDIFNESVSMWWDMAWDLDVDPDVLVARISEEYPSVAQLEAQFKFIVHTFQFALSEKVVEQLDDTNVAALARNEAIDSEYKMVQGEISTFFGECMQAIRKEVSTCCNGVLKQMGSGKTEGVHQSSINKVKNMIDHVKTMDWTNNTELQSELDAFKTQFLDTKAKDYRKNTDALKDFQTGMKAFTKNITAIVDKDNEELIDKFTQSGHRKIRILNAE